MIEIHFSIKMENKEFKEFQKILFSWIQINEDKIEDIYYNTNTVKKEKDE